MAEGLQKRYNVTRVDGRDQPGGDRVDSKLFVLDIVHDLAARSALRDYLNRTRNDDLAADLRELLDETAEQALRHALVKQKTIPAELTDVYCIDEAVRNMEGHGELLYSNESNSYYARRNAVPLKSRPAEMVVYDEVDEMMPEMVLPTSNYVAGNHEQVAGRMIRDACPVEIKD
jgi:hypothetical protein